MTQTTSRLLDELAKLMTDAAGAAQGVKREVETVLRTQAERLVSDMDLVHREEFEALRELAMNAREENERLRARIIELENRLGIGGQPALPGA
jgi:BMFP domain-containing protein YqiC